VRYVNCLICFSPSHNTADWSFFKSLPALGRTSVGKETGPIRNHVTTLLSCRKCAHSTYRLPSGQGKHWNHVWRASQLAVEDIANFVDTSIITLSLRSAPQNIWLNIDDFAFRQYVQHIYSFPSNFVKLTLQIMQLFTNFQRLILKANWVTGLPTSLL
jgi:hypothetical protein